MAVNRCEPSSPGILTLRSVRRLRYARLNLIQTIVSQGAPTFSVLILQAETDVFAPTVAKLQPGPIVGKNSYFQHYPYGSICRELF